MEVIIGGLFYSETTWVWRFAQWMHHEVHGGGKNPEAEGKTLHPCGFAFIPHFICEDIDICRHLIVLDKSKWSVWTLSPRQLNSLLWWHHNIYLWCHNGACRHARSKYYEYFSLKRLYANCLCTLIKDSYLFVVLYTCTWLNNMKLNRLILLKLWYISQLRMFSLLISASVFEVLHTWSDSTPRVFYLHRQSDIVGQNICMSELNDANRTKCPG